MDTDPAGRPTSHRFQTMPHAPPLGMSPPGPAILERYASQDSGPSDFHQPELPHADDRGPLASSGYACRRERGWTIDSAAPPLLRPARRPGGGLRLPYRTRRRQARQGLPLQRRTTHAAHPTGPLQGAAGNGGIPAHRQSRPGHALHVPRDLPETARRHHAPAGRTRNGAFGFQPAPVSYTHLTLPTNREV